MFKTFTGPAATADAANTPGWRRADMGAINGHGNARSVARMLSALALGGTVDGVRLLSQDTIDLIFDEQSHGPDLVLGVNLRFGIGYALPETETLPYVAQGKSCYWGGWGGSVILTRPRLAYDDQLHDEPDGPRHHRLGPLRGLRAGDPRRAAEA